MIYIIVEGLTDKALIKNILANKTEDIDFKFSGLKGIDSIKSTLEKLNPHDLSQNKYFAIVDADASFVKINTEMIRLTQNNDVEFYIFPNHKGDGDLETLILSQVNEENEIIKCFDAYTACAKKYKDVGIDNKAKLYAYTTLEHNQRPEQYIAKLTIGTEFNQLKQKLQTLFEGTN